MRSLGFSLLLFSLFFTGCVSSGKFRRMEDSLSKERDSLRTIVKGLDSTIGVRDKQIADLQKQKAGLESERQDNRKRTQSLLADLDNMSQNYQQAREHSSAEIKLLLDSLQTAQNNLSDRELRLRELEHALATRDSTLNAVKAKLNDALLGFKDTGLSINIVNGKIYVSLSNQLLFSTGKTTIDKRGKDALTELAGVLNSNADLSILVEGHTDNAQVINLGAIKDNWDLSVMRATEVVRFLTQEGKLDPARLTASGRSEYSPLEAGSAAEARAKNRRTEIILIPKLGELFDLVKQ